MLVSVVIPTHNRVLKLRELCSDLKRLIIPSNLAVRVIIVADGCTDGTLVMLQEEFPDFVILCGPGDWWFTKSLNQGCIKARDGGSEFVLTLNDDCRIPADLLAILWKNLLALKLEAIGAVTLVQSPFCRITFSGAKNFSRVLLKFKPYHDPRLKIDPANLSGCRPTFSLMTRGLLFDTKAAEVIGYFDEVNFPQYGSDEDFALRLLRQGYKVQVCYDAQVYDHPDLTSKGSAVNRPPFKEFVSSFFSRYTINSLSKTINFQKKHGHKWLLAFNILYFVAGTFYSYLWKYRRSNT